MRAAGRRSQLVGTCQQGFVIELGGQARIVLECLVPRPFQLSRHPGVREAASCQFAGEVAERAPLRSEASHEFALQRMDPGCGRQGQQRVLRCPHHGTVRQAGALTLLPFHQRVEAFYVAAGHLPLQVPRAAVREG